MTDNLRTEFTLSILSTSLIPLLSQPSPFRMPPLPQHLSTYDVSSLLTRGTWLVEVVREVFTSGIRKEMGTMQFESKVTRRKSVDSIGLTMAYVSLSSRYLWVVTDKCTLSFLARNLLGRFTRSSLAVQPFRLSSSFGTCQRRLDRGSRVP